MLWWRSRPRLLIVAIAGLVAHGEAVAQVDGAAAVAPVTPWLPPAPPVSTPEGAAHHGLFLGAHLGLGELHFGYGPYVFWGRSHPIDVWMGGALTRNLLLFGQLYDAHVFGPSSTYGELSDLNFLGVGPGLKYYLTPTNIFLSGSLLLSKVRFGSEVDESTAWGATFRLTLGKEWQVSRRWSLGLEGEALYGRMGLRDPSRDSAGTMKSFSVLVSTYNQEATERDTPDDQNDGSNLLIETRGGVGHLWSRYGVDSAAGTIVPVELSAGRLVSPRVAVLGDFTYARLPELRAGLYPDLQSARSYGLGLRVKYDLQPAGTFVEAAVGYTRFDFQNTTSPYYHPGPQTGVAAHMTIGKEWWVLRHWALGLAGDLLLGAVEGGEDGMHVPKALSLLALVTYSSPRRSGNAGAAVPGEQAAPAVPSALGQPPAASVPAEPTAAAVEVAAPRPPHEGFHLGARLGAGWLDVTTTNSNGAYRIRGAGVPFALSAGWALTPDWVVFGEFSEHQVRRPENSNNNGLIDLDLLAVGPGVTYYAPAGVFVSGALSLSQVSYRDGAPLDPRYGTNVTSPWGYTGRLSVGEEWRVSRYVGLGLAAEAALGRVRESQTDTVYTVKALSALATVTFD